MTALSPVVGKIVPLTELREAKPTQVKTCPYATTGGSWFVYTTDGAEEDDQLTIECKGTLHSFLTYTENK